MTYFLGIDASTTATKALLIDRDGRVAAAAASEYGYQTPRPLWSEQDPGLWWRGAVESIRRALSGSGIEGKDVQAVGLSGQMHGLVLLDQDGDVLRPAILWNDQRTGAECDQIRRWIGKETLVQWTGNDALTGFTAPKILWVQKHEPDIWERSRHIMLPKDYLRYRLTGGFASDKAGASGSLLFDLRSRDWSREMLEALSIPQSYMPPTFEGPAETLTVSPEAARQTGLRAGIPVVAGGGDQAAAAVGTGAVETGTVSLSLGTSGVVFATTAEPVVEPQGRLHAFCHAVPEKWHLMGVMLSAAGSLRWFRETFDPGSPYEALLAPAEAVPPGSGGLLFLPYLTGERTPHPDPAARGAFVGLTVRHRMPHLTRAVLEGVAFGLRDCFELLRTSGLPDISQVRITGGGARSPLWRQILADVLGCELQTVNTEEGAAFGAALLAGVGSGHWPDVESACRAAIRLTGSTAPGAAQEAYAGLYPVYQALYPALRPSFQNLSASER